MFTTIITDCKEENEKGRQITRYHQLGLGPATLVGVDSNLGLAATIESAGNLIDILDASNGRPGVIVSNVAPRGYKEEDGENGTEFSYFWHNETLVIATIKGYNLSLIKKLHITETVRLAKLDVVLENAVFSGLLDENIARHILNSQFRSFDYVPRLARWIVDQEMLPTFPLSLQQIKDIPNAVWCIDAFGNAKTTILSNEVDFKEGQTIQTSLGELTFYNRLKNVPHGEPGMYIGSSGFEDKRFLEIAVQSADIENSAKNAFGLKVGTEIQLQYV